MLPVTYLVPTTYASVLILLPLLGFFNNGIFSGFPIYLPELNPTRLRATGPGLLLNGGLDLSYRISSLNLCTGNQGQTPAGMRNNRFRVSGEHISP